MGILQSVNGIIPVNLFISSVLGINYLEAYKTYKVVNLAKCVMFGTVPENRFFLKWLQKILVVLKRNRVLQINSICYVGNKINCSIKIISGYRSKYQSDLKFSYRCESIGNLYNCHGIVP